MRTIPPCVAGPRWLKQPAGTRGKLSLAPLTGQDTRALHAFVHLLELYACSDDDGHEAAIVAMRAVLGAMQPSTRHLAKASIPFVLDWGDEDRLWVDLTQFEAA